MINIYGLYCLLKKKLEELQALVEAGGGSSGSTGTIPDVEHYSDLPTSVSGVKIYAVMSDERNNNKTTFYALYGNTKQWLFSQEA